MLTCERCDHFLDRAAPDATAEPGKHNLSVAVGICRRFAPRIIDDMSLFPSVHRRQRCGEFTPNASVLPI